MLAGGASPFPTPCRLTTRFVLRARVYPSHPLRATKDNHDRTRDYQDISQPVSLLSQAKPPLDIVATPDPGAARGEPKTAYAEVNGKLCNFAYSNDPSAVIRRLLDNSGKAYRSNVQEREAHGETVVNAITIIGTGAVPQVDESARRFLRLGGVPSVASRPGAPANPHS